MSNKRRIIYHLKKTWLILGVVWTLWQSKTFKLFPAINLSKNTNKIMHLAKITLNLHHFEPKYLEIAECLDLWTELFSEVRWSKLW